MYLKYNHLKLLHELITDVNKIEKPAFGAGPEHADLRYYVDDGNYPRLYHTLV